ncbi:MAG: T9SS type A sorting domain-containing protein [Sphingobacteriaceae bacterium]|nr:T9SS type A sorting domain-containing protein [Sphingobacteriaceae bacterium]
MKKLIILLFISISTLLNAQTSTFVKTYSVQNLTPAGFHPKTIIYGNSQFIVHAEGSGSLSIQKNNLNGIPVTKRSYANYSILGNPSYYLETLNGTLLISGSKTTSLGTVPFILRLDTTNCNSILAADYIIAGYNSIRINDAKVLNNGNLILVGGASNTGTSTAQDGFVLAINIPANGSPLYSHTLTVNSSTNTSLISIQEISNSSFMFSASGNGSPYLGKALKTTSTFSTINAYGCSIGASRLNSYTNAKKVFAHTNDLIFKLDTNLAQLSLSAQMGINMPACLGTKYANNKIYRMLTGNVVHIVDTAYAVIANTYSSVIASSLTPKDVVSDANNIYVTFGSNSTSNRHDLLKASLTGTMNCSSQVIPNPVTNGTNGGSVTATSAPVPFNLLFNNPVSPTISVTYTDVCNSVGINEIIKNNSLRLTSNNGIYHIAIANEIENIQLFDLGGKLIANFTFNSNSNQERINLNDLTTGIYIIKITDSNKNEFKGKLIR